jgi:hypothetical protein
MNYVQKRAPTMKMVNLLLNKPINKKQMKEHENLLIYGTTENPQN